MYNAKCARGVHGLAPAAITRYHKLDDLNYRSVFSHSAGCARPRCGLGWFLPGWGRTCPRPSLSFWWFSGNLWWSFPPWASLVAQRLKRLPRIQETRIQSLGREDPLEKEMATYSSTLAWRIPWTEEPGGLQSVGSQRVRHDWVTSLSLWWSLAYRNISAFILIWSMPTPPSLITFSTILFPNQSLRYWGLEISHLFNMTWSICV